MWYVIQVAGGREEETAGLIRTQISPDVMEESFIPRKERIKKFRGRWQQVEEILFPGYVFAVTDRPEELFLELKRVTRLTKILQDGEAFFIPLSREEEEMIRGIGDNYHVTRVSKVRVSEKKKEESEGLNGKIIEYGKQVIILDGPLKNQEGKIIKYDFHKREVAVKIPFLGNEVELRFGIELVEEKE